MKLLTTAIIRAELPDLLDEKDDDDDYDQVRAFEIAVVIASIFRTLKYRISTPERDDNGWCSYLRKSGRTILLHFTDAGDCYLLQSDDVTAPWKRAWVRPIHDGVLQDLNAALAQDPRFHSVKWFPKGSGLGNEDEGRDAPVVSAV
jgi:hypothetical protein